MAVYRQVAINIELPHVNQAINAIVQSTADTYHYMHVAAFRLQMVINVIYRVSEAVDNATHELKVRIQQAILTSIEVHNATVIRSWPSRIILFRMEPNPSVFWNVLDRP